MKDKRFKDDYDLFDKITVYAMMILLFTLFFLAIYVNITTGLAPLKPYIEGAFPPFG